MKTKRFITIAVIGLLIVSTAACFLPNPEIIISMSDDKAMEQHDSEVDIYEEADGGISRSLTAGIQTSGARAPKTKVEDFEKTITYKARILPVEVDGVSVHANDVVINGNTAYIAYNYAGSLFKGAIQIVDISSPGEPEILTEITFSNMDINTIEISGGDLYFGGQTDATQFGFRSFIGKIELSSLPNVDIEAIINSLVGLQSYATTAITNHGNTFYVGVGALDGGVQILNSSLSITGFIDLPDVRDVWNYQNGFITVAGTTDNDQENGRVLIYPANDLENPVVFSLPDFDSPYHKSTIETHNSKYAFLGLSEAGMKVLDIKANEEDSEFVFELDNPTADFTDKTNTNSVSTDGSYIFSANGEYGFRLLRLLNLSGKNATFAEVVGYISYEGLNEGGTPYSANHIDFKANHIFVASGIGGVNIYYLN